MASDINVAILIPVYNNEKTIKEVIVSAQKYCNSIIVVNDGSTDKTNDIISQIPNIKIISFPKNQGKGSALKAGFEFAINLGFTHIITIDGDNQHKSVDIPKFLEKIHEDKNALWIGNRTIVTDGDNPPPRSKYGRIFGNFWYKFITGIRINDTQCGFRAYPLNEIKNLNIKGKKYEFEQDVLIKAAWNKIKVKEFDIHINYQPLETRVSHFRPIRDFLRITLINSKAAITRIMFPVITMDIKGNSVWEKTGNLVKNELKAHHQPFRAALSTSLGVFIGIFPIHGFQVITLSFVTAIFKLNFPLAFLGVSVSSAPFLPFLIFLAITIGRMVVPQDFIIHSASGTVSTIAENGIAFLVGSVILSVIASLATFIILYPMFSSIAKIRNSNSSTSNNSKKI